MDPEKSRWGDLVSESRRKIRGWCIQAFFGLLGYGVIIFLAAGGLDWLWGWIFLVLTAAFLACHPLLLVPINPDLLVERSGGLRQEGGKAWDRWLAAIAGGILPMISWILAALDYRFGWSIPKPLFLHLIGSDFVAVGWGIFLWAMVSNAFFSEVVRIQDERSHEVATSGPYRFVRHPGYAGAILAFIGTPMLMGSWWSMIPAVLGVGGYVLRTALEDRTLQAELLGYREYSEDVRYRLIPGVW